jgi:predicted dehydrogenase
MESVASEPIISLGMIGFSPGNGHPYSFSAILNGYDEMRLRGAGWDVIADYLAPHAQTGCGVLPAQVVAAWSPDEAATRQLAEACRIEHVATSLEDLCDRVDAVLLARDDWTSHAQLALPILERGIPVFVDKPLTLDADELAAFAPHIEAGRLASWTALRFAPELTALEAVVDPVVVRGLGVEEWDRYGIHVLEPALQLLRSAPVEVRPVGARHAALAFVDAEGRVVEVDVLGPGATVGFHLQVASRDRVEHAALTDRFTAFRRALDAFVTQVREGAPVVPPHETLTTIRALIAGREALDRDAPVAIPES